MTKCQLCNCEMGCAAKPYYVIDTTTRQLLAVAHAGCARAQEQTNPNMLLIRANKTLSPDAVVFASKAFRIKKRLFPERSHVSSHAGIILSECIGVAESLEQCFLTQRSRELFDWWVNGAKILSAREVEQVKTRLRNEFKAGAT